MNIERGRAVRLDTRYSFYQAFLVLAMADLHMHSPTRADQHILSHNSKSATNSEDSVTATSDSSG